MALFNRQDKKDKKKGLESTIGKIIYGFLLFAPLLSILTTCMYVIFNKNAFESYYGETINEKIYNSVTNKNDLNVNDVYQLRLENKTNLSNIGGNNQRISFDYIDIIQNTYNLDIANAKSVGFYSGTSNNFISYWYDNTDTLIGTISFGSNILIADIKYLSNNLLDYNILTYEVLYKITYNKYSYLDNNFEYGIYKTEQSTLFNWSKSTGTYQIMETTTQGLGITNTFIPMLMTYWLLISVIYFIYDIALVLIMMVHKKIHEFQESL